MPPVWRGDTNYLVLSSSVGFMATLAGNLPDSSDLEGC
jgi:hypothetical protein